jgi:hypothetical protein
MNNTYLDNGMLWNLSFDSIAQLPQVVFKIEEATNSASFKLVALSRVAQEGAHKITGYLSMADLFAKEEGEDTTEIDVQADYVIREIRVSYLDGTETITSSIKTEYPLETSAIDEPEQIDQQAIKIIQGTDLNFYLPKFLGRPNDDFSIYLGETINECSWPGFTKPEQATRADIAELLVKDKEGRLTDAIEANGKVFVVSEKDSEGSLKAIDPITLVLVRCNYAKAWTVEYNLTSNSPISGEMVIDSNSQWMKAAPKMETTPVPVPIYREFYNAEGWFDPNEYSAQVESSVIDNYVEPELIEAEYTKVMIQNFASTERIIS